MYVFRYGLELAMPELMLTVARRVLYKGEDFSPQHIGAPAWQ
jgi:hypothetical protein